MKPATKSPRDLRRPAKSRGTWRTSVEAAVEQTVQYADIFDYPLTAPEIHRFLIGAAGSPEALAPAIGRGLALGILESAAGYVFLSGHRHLLAIRQRRQAAAQQLWTAARRFGRLINAIPFVRMVAVTGALAMSNVEPGDDIDLLVVTAPGRLWLCRGLVVLVARLAALLGYEICPNYCITTERLALDDRNLYSAHELAQMLPLHGYAVYHQMWHANDWVANYLPNAQPLPPPAVAGGQPAGLKWLGERILGGKIGDWLERWEQTRKVRRLLARAAREGGSTAFSSSECRGHFADHGRRVMDELAQRSRHWRD